MAVLSIDRVIKSLDDEQLESFVRDWVSKKPDYVEVKRFTGPGDMGRDVVGYRTGSRHEGPWDNYQCKQYGRTLDTGVALAELGKVLYFAFRGEFLAPANFFFVAPRGLNRALEGLIANPSRLREALVARWDTCCATKISKGEAVPMSPELRAFLEEWDFSRVSSFGTEGIETDPAAKSVLQEWFGTDPGPPPAGVVPDAISDRELPYIEQLLGAYSERDGSVIDRQSVHAHAEHGPHLRLQRERFFDADAFERFYRDNTMESDVAVLRKDVRHGVAETLAATYPDALGRVNAVMTQAAVLQPSGALAHHAGVPVRQGICHHFANEGTLRWRKP